MILGKPTLQSVSNYVIAEGCPECGHLPGWLEIVSPDEMLEGCDHVVDVSDWRDSHHLEGELDASELGGNSDEP